MLTDRQQKVAPILSATPKIYKKLEQKEKKYPDENMCMQNKKYVSGKNSPVALVVFELILVVQKYVLVIWKNGIEHVKNYDIEV